MDTIECLVCYGTRKIVVTVGGERRRPDLIRSLGQKEAFQGLDLQSSDILVYHAGFGTDVDLTEDMVLQDKAQLKVARDESQYRVMDVIIQEAPGPSRVSVKDRSAYSFTAVPLDIMQSLGKHTKGHHLSCRSRIIELLYHDLCLYDLFPDKLYEMAAKGLVRTFPDLKDSTGTGYDSWRVAMRYKAKRERRKLRERARQEDVCEGEVRPPKQSRPLRDPTPRRVTRPGTDIVLPTDGEDGDSIRGHILGTQKELEKPRPNMAYVEDSMTRTLATRRLWVTVEHPSVAAIVERYPALQHGTFVQQEFTAVTGQTIGDRLVAGLVKSSLRILEAARSKRHLAGFFQDFDERFASTESSPEDEMLFRAALQALPSLVKERSLSFLYPDDPAGQPTYPAIGYEGDTVYEATSFVVSVDELHIQESTLLGALNTM
ncbi:unnamed protein product [Ixodes hexagonus]